MNGEIGVLAPHMHIGIWLLPLVAILFSYRERARTRALRSLGRSNESGSRMRCILPLLALCLLVFSLLRPYWGFEEVELRSPGQDVLVVFDISKSMGADDVLPTRLEAGKRKLLDLTKALEEIGSPARIGIVLFAGDAFLYCPLTQDLPVVRTFIRSISHELITAQGSALKDALRLAIDAMQKAASTSGRILVISDGEDYGLDVGAEQYFTPTQVAKSRTEIEALLKEHRVPIDAIGLGTLTGVPLPVNRGRYLKDGKGEIVISRLREPVLKFLAETSGGFYRRSTLNDSGVHLLVDKLRSAENKLIDVEGATVPGTYRIYNELGPYLIAAALTVLLLMFAAGKPEYVLALLLVPGLFSATEKAFAADDKLASTEAEVKEETPPVSTYDAYRAYEAGEYNRAMQGFEQAYRETPEDTAVLHAYGNSLYRNQDYEAAEQVYEELAARATTPRKRFHGLYNSGNAKFMKQDFEGALKQYEKALQVKPRDEPAIFNHELAKKLLEQQQQQEQEKQDENQDQEQQQEQEKQEENQEQDQQQEQQNQQSSQQEQDESEQQKESDQEQADQAQQDKEQQEQNPSPEDSEKDSTQDEQKNEDQGEKGEEQEQEQEQEQDKNSGEAGKDSQEQDQDGDQRDAKAGQLPEHSAEALQEREARSWLESLPDAPVLLQKQRSRGSQGGITW